jgi:prepilin-type N-terminal cleavage/methylation domain-containing protein
MKSSRHRYLSKAIGYSLVEMMMTLAIGLVLVSVALPTMIGAIQGYRLNSVAQQVANLAELTRYSAIRRNSVISLRQVVQNGNTILFVDLDGDGNLGATEPLVMLPSDMQIANGQSLTPPAASIGQPTQDFAGQIIFDYRGTVNFTGGGPMTAYFLALGYTNQAQYGCRAITVSPMGQTKTWKAPAGGTWTGM